MVDSLDIIDIDAFEEKTVPHVIEPKAGILVL